MAAAAATSSEPEVASLLGCAADYVHASICAQIRRFAAGDSPWALQVGPSSAGPTSGDGVQLIGTCPAGSVLACYPGVTYALEDLPVMSKIVLPGNAYVVARRDGVLLDARPDGASAAVLEMARARDAARRTPQSPAGGGAFAIGHKVNHPPPHSRPNVLLYPFDLQRGQHEELQALLGVLPFRPPAEGEPACRSAVLIATRQLADEELFLDYKLRVDGPVEPWYHPVDREA